MTFSRPHNVILVEVYALALMCKVSETEEFHRMLKRAVEAVPKKDILI